MMAPSLRRSLRIVLVAEGLARTLPVLTLGYSARALGAASFGQAHLVLSAMDVGLVAVSFGYS